MRPAAPAAWLAAEGLRVVQASLDDVRLGPDRLSFVFARGNADHADAIVCDAQTDDDLAAIARAALSLVPMPLCVGSAGLMGALAGGEGGATAEQACDTTALKPVMIAVGSASQVSQGQVQTLIAERAMRAVMIAPAALRAGRTSGPVRLVSNQISEALASGSDLIVAIDRNGPGYPDPFWGLRAEGLWRGRTWDPPFVRIGPVRVVCRYEGGGVRRP
jgi:uncharacterized protein YgbK (DUF1537 family)